MILNTKQLSLELNESLTAVQSLKLAGCELAGRSSELFSMRLRAKDGSIRIVNASAAKSIAEIEDGAVVLTYTFEDLTVTVRVCAEDAVRWNLSVKNRSDYAVEFVDFPSLTVAGKLRRNGGEDAVVLPYNEGVLVEDSQMKTEMLDPEFPSLGRYMMFPYMVFAQFMLYMHGSHGLYIGVHDSSRGPKGLDFKCSPNETEFRIRLFLGGTFGGDVCTPEVFWQGFEGNWQDGADIYRAWLKSDMRIPTLTELSVPDWYLNDMPLVITYPVRGIHDMDEMNPNKLFPYENVLPLVEEFSEKTHSRIMVLLMHWEGTAPWAPPYVFPPYGGEEMFRSFMEKLHKDGNLLGVYCSGLGFTEQSNLIAAYNNTDMIEKQGLKKGFCTAPDQSVPHSRICCGQRSGYDICPASSLGRNLLDDALAPLLESGVDYIQALDQNHGGGMYFCYSQDHGHPPVPGEWMTQASKSLLRGWKEKAPNTLLGCESAAAEPYIEELRLSDNRYELCYEIGRPIPVYAYLYHPYLKNFMGNQVACPLAYTTELCELRLAYSFLAGDLLTLVLNDDGEIMFHWGMRDFSRTPDRAELISFVATLQQWHAVYPELFRDAEMVKPLAVACAERKLDVLYGAPTYEDVVLTSAWRVGSKTVQLLANWTHDVQQVNISGACGTIVRSDGSKETLNDSNLTLKGLEVLAIEY